MYNLLMHKENLTIGSNDVDSSLRLRISSLFKIMQEVIMHDAEIHNGGKEETIDKGILWIALRTKLEINRLPTYKEEIIASTHLNKIISLAYPRHFKIVDSNSKTLVNIVSIWSLIDKENRKLTQNGKIENSSEFEKYDDDLSWPNKIKNKDAHFIKEETIKYSSIDLNGHLNNTKYIEILEDLHDSTFYQDNQIKSLTVNYLKEIKEKDTIKIYSIMENNVEFVRFEKNGEIAFLAEIEYY